MDKSNRIKGILFDLDDTLVNLDVNWDFVKKSVSAITNGSTNSFREAYANADDFVKKVLSDTLMDLEIKGAHSSKPVDGINVINNLKERHKIAIVTRNCKKCAEIALNKHVNHCPLVIGREDVQNLKPHPEGLILAINKLKLNPKSTVLVGDSNYDVEAGHAAGIKVIIVNNSTLAYPPTGYDYYISNLYELPELIKQISSQDV